MTLIVVILIATLVALVVARAVPADPPPAEPAASAVAATAGAATVQGKGVRWWARRAVQARKDANARGRTIRRLKADLARTSQQKVTATLAISLVFGKHAGEALRVAWCESHWYTGARNGQYLGLFQMGDYARGRYGHGSDAYTQAKAAYAYFAASGYDWSPWECRP